MAKKGLEPDIDSIVSLCREGKNFLLSGGAGSGKTYALAKVIGKVIVEYPTARIACMTYTNAAVKEIEDRVNHENLSVSTIHDFLWDNIKSFQKELKLILIELLREEDSGLTIPDVEVTDDFFKDLDDGIQYKEFTRLKDGIISHDDLIQLAHGMFKKYPLLCTMVKDTYRFIFFDEYQDTHPLVVEIFLTHLKQSAKSNVIGFFGDSMQAIYDDVIGDLDLFTKNGDVTEVKREQNRRNPQLVIDLANKLRTDGLEQKPSDDPEAPNMVDGKIKKGTIQFLHSDNPDISNVKNHLKWDFNNPRKVKELNLTHNMIAPKAGFKELMEIYDNDPIVALKSDIQKKIKESNKPGKQPIVMVPDETFDQVVTKLKIKRKTGESRKDEILRLHPDLYNKVKGMLYEDVKKIYLDKEALIDDKKQNNEEESRKGSKRDRLIKHLFKIQSNVHLYEEKQYNEFIRKTEFYLRTNKDKEELANIINKLQQMGENTIEDVIDYAHDSGICIKDDNVLNFINEKTYLYDRVRKVKFSQFQNLYYYLEGYTPFSTQHKIKGNEFDNVLVILDNGNWSNYNFEYLFHNRTDRQSVLSRTQKIFYVCCTRAKENLAVFFYNPDATTLEKAELWFGKENVIKV